MIRLLRDLPERDQRQLLAMFRPEEALAVDATDLWPTLASVLKTDALAVSASADLPGAMRDGLVDVAVSRLRVLDSADDLTDIEIALALTEFLLRVPAAVETNDDLRGKLEVFFKTRDPKLWATTIAETAAMEEGLLSAAADGRGTLYAKLLDGLSAGAGGLKQTTGNVPTRVRVLQGMAALGAGSVALAALTPAPVGLLAGALFMAGLGAGDDDAVVQPVADEADKARASRARKSKFVQNVVRISVFAIAAIGDAARARQVVLRYLRDLEFGFEELESGAIEVPAGSATVTVSFSNNAGRCVITLRSRLLSGAEAGDRDLVELLRLNNEIPLGRFGWDEEAAAVDVSYEILADTLDIDELGFALARISEIADASDDLLEEHFGKAMAEQTQGGVK
jgi:hypothetical protein